ncbi:MAG TPA: hypothetical protein VFO96_06250 [Gemmatimonadales bacterium]|jgi:hypothetical protein|nr:hypothetical protein [Gemmatimonadales bacterium]
MKAQACLAALLLVCVSPLRGQAVRDSTVHRPPAVSTDVSSIDSIVSALYQTISGPVGAPRQWARFFSLMDPAARLIPTGCDTVGNCRRRILTAEQYQERSDSLLTALGFHERALVNKVERFGNIAHVFSSYASFRRDETKPFSRGINSIQLFWDGHRWWVLSVFWDSERMGNALPRAME